MSRVKGYPQTQLRGQFVAFMRTNARLLAAVAVFEILIIGSVTVFIWKMSQHNMLTGYVLGALHVATVALVYYALRMVFFANEGSAIHQLRGSLGESNTRDELRRARRRRIIWGWVDSIAVQGGDVDHLVITRKGGLVAIDSKWRSQTNWDVRASAEAADRARRRASLILRHLKYLARDHDARHRLDAISVTVEPLVVVWGAAQRDVPHGVKIHEATFVGGGSLLDWLRALEGNRIDKQAAAQLKSDLEEFRTKQSANR
jgi:hypothetical protein